MSMVNMVSPWIDFYRKVEALFKQDPDICVIYDDEQRELKLYVENADKAFCLAEVMPLHKDFGNVELGISIIPANGLAKAARIKAEEYFHHVFANNPILSDIQTVYGVFSNPITYVVFRKEVVQYFNDDLGDINGLCSTLWQNIAKDIFTETEGVYFCTDKSDYYMTFTNNGVTVSHNCIDPGILR